MDATSVAPKDVVIAVLGAAAALAGFLLVFLGVVISGLLSFDPAVKNVVRGPYLLAGGIAMTAFFFSVGTVALGVDWLAYGQSRLAYHLAIWLLFGDLALVLVVGLITAIQALGD